MREGEILKTSLNLTLVQKTRFRLFFAPAINPIRMNISPESREETFLFNTRKHFCVNNQLSFRSSEEFLDFILPLSLIFIDEIMKKLTEEKWRDLTMKK